MATDGNAANAATEFVTDLERLDVLVDWPLMTAMRWHNTESDPTGSAGGWPNC